MAARSAKSVFTTRRLDRLAPLRALPGMLLLIFVCASPGAQASDPLSRFEGRWMPVKNASLIIIIHRHADLFHCHTSRSDYALRSSGKTLIYAKHCVPLRGYYQLSADGNTLTDHVSFAGQEKLVRVYTRLTGPSLKAMKRQGQWFLAAINGRQIGPFDQLRSFSDGQYAAKSDGNWRVYTQEGDIASGFVWKDIQPLVPGRYAGKNNRGKWQLLASTGQPVSRFMWDEIKAIPKGRQR